MCVASACYTEAGRGPAGKTEWALPVMGAPWPWLWTWDKRGTTFRKPQSCCFISVLFIDGFPNPRRLVLEMRGIRCMVQYPSFAAPT